MNSIEHYERRASTLMFCLGVAFLIAGIIMFVLAGAARVETQAMISEMEHTCGQWNIENGMIKDAAKIPEVWPDPGNDFSTANTTKIYAD